MTSSPYVIMSSHVIFWPTPPPPQVMTSFMDSPLPLPCISGQQLAISIIFLSKFQFSWKEMFAEKFFSLCSKFARPVDSSGGRASTNPQIWQLFLQATSQVMTAHNLFAPSHSVVLPFGFILKLIPDANFAVHYYTLTRWSSRFANALLVKAHWVPLGFYT